MSDIMSSLRSETSLTAELRSKTVLAIEMTSPSTVEFKARTDDSMVYVGSCSSFSEHSFVLNSDPVTVTSTFSDKRTFSRHDMGY